MRRRITRTLLAAAAAGVTVSTLGFTAAGAANATVTGTAARTVIAPMPIANTYAAGYELSGRNFRFIAATLTVPDWTSSILYPSEFIQLSNGSLPEHLNPGSDQYVRAGIEPCVVARTFGAICTTGDWVSFVEAFNNSLSGPYFSHFSDLSGVAAGDGVFFSVYFDQGGNELHFVITPPSTSGPSQSYKTNAHGPIFNYAAALDDFTNSTGVPVPVPPFFDQYRINQFLGGAVTTYSGDGLMVSTPVGSTGHSLSSGGPILRQDLAAFVITPICPHALTTRPLVDSSECTFTLTVPEAPEGTTLVIDGQVRLGLTAADRIDVRRTSANFQTAKLPGSSYYATLHRKLGWGGQTNYET